MENQLKQITCDPTCGFMVRSHNKNEVVDMAMNHVKHAHKDMKVSKAQINDMVKNV